MKKLWKCLIYLFAMIGFALVVMYFLVKFGFTNSTGIIDNQRDYFKNELELKENAWSKTEEWQILKEAVAKDSEVISLAGKKVGVSPRLIVSILVVEQMRLFSSEREIFKQVFAPLKILGNQSQFSWGVMGIKQETAREIENHLKDTSSPFYLGLEYENLLNFSSDEPNNERFLRLTDEKNRYYSYLYAAIMIKQIETQWQKAGFPLEYRPEITATLFNIGFKHSVPKADPQVGGAEIEIGENTYSFGGLAGSFYRSQELIENFPR